MKRNEKLDSFNKWNSLANFGEKDENKELDVNVLGKEGYDESKQERLKRTSKFYSSVNNPESSAWLSSRNISKSKINEIGSSSIPHKRRPSKKRKNNSKRQRSKKRSVSRKNSFRKSTIEKMKNDSTIKSRSDWNFKKINNSKQNHLGSISVRNHLKKSKGLDSPTNDNIIEKLNLKTTSKGYLNLNEKNRNWMGISKDSSKTSMMKTQLINSLDRKSINHNMKMSIFSVTQKVIEQSYPPKSPEGMGTSLFSFLLDHKGRSSSKQQERGYLLIDKKSRINPSYKKDTNSKNSTVIAFWISGENLTDPSTLSQTLLKRIKNKLTAISSKNNYIWSRWIQKYWKGMNSRASRIKIDENFVIQKSHNKNNLLMNSKDKLHTEGNIENTEGKLVYLFTLARKDYIKNVWICWKSLRNENNLERHRRRSSNRSSKRRKEWNTLSKSKPTILSKLISEQNLATVYNEKVENNLKSKIKYSFGDANITGGDKENIPTNIILSYTKLKKDCSKEILKDNSNTKGSFQI